MIKDTSNIFFLKHLILEAKYSTILLVTLKVFAVFLLIFLQVWLYAKYKFEITSVILAISSFFYLGYRNKAVEDLILEEYTLYEESKEMPNLIINQPMSDGCNVVLKLKNSSDTTIFIDKIYVFSKGKFFYQKGNFVNMPNPRTCIIEKRAIEPKKDYIIYFSYPNKHINDQKNYIFIKVQKKYFSKHLKFNINKIQNKYENIYCVYNGRKYQVADYITIDTKTKRDILKLDMYK